MTRNNQIIRAWISKRKSHGTWWSNVSFRGTVHRFDTGSKHRLAATEFSHLHLRQILNTPSK